jgi:hypothetical protein
MEFVVLDKNSLNLNLGGVSWLVERKQMLRDGTWFLNSKLCVSNCMKNTIYVIGTNLMVQRRMSTRWLVLFGYTTKHGGRVWYKD